MFNKFLIFLLFFGTLILPGCKSSKKVLYIYGWAGYFPPELLKEFQKETGIEAIYDTYESEEILETDLCMENSYDVVIITAWPSFARTTKAKLFRPLSKEQIPNLKYIDSAFLEKVSCIDSEHCYGVPYLFGSVGLGVNLDKISNSGVKDLRTWGMIFDYKVIRKLSSYRIYLLDNAKDVFQAVLLYLGKDPCSTDKKLWKQAYDFLKKIRPFITRFQNARQEDTLLAQEASILQGFSDNIALAAFQGKQYSPSVNICYVVPKEGVMMTIDMMAIPKRATHIEAAHKFINFVLRPKNMAAISNALKTANTSSHSHPWIFPELLKNREIFPDKKHFKKFHGDFLPSIELTRYISDLWLDLMGEKNVELPISDGSEDE
ncbi:MULTISPECIES: extracellular solute-binding protein [Holospora]|uniref:Putrescine-binding periplasmic protein n=2 Tax=Holospora TaxID=44747 RepID=A0A061JGE5_9PROT|nr:MULTISPECIES: extracellular solute-binding protein [Holospora]ETZ05050.1 putrescine-binding periplasmic protein [Holospora undulata HU1]GAJ46745.1 putrescine-binding periplasmic protein [Holospora elegans E1]